MSRTESRACPKLSSGERPMVDTVQADLGRDCVNKLQDQPIMSSEASRYHVAPIGS